MKLKITLLATVLVLAVTSACGPTVTPTAVVPTPISTLAAVQSTPTVAAVQSTSTAAPEATATTGEKAVVVVWHGDSDPVAKVTEDLINTEFNKLYPNIEVKYELAPDPMQQKMLAAIPVGNGPDLFEWNHDWIGTFAEAGLIEPIDDLVTPDLQAKYVPSAFQAGQYKGKLYTLPISAEVGALAYNKALLGSNPVPKTTEEFVNLMTELKQPGGYGISYPIVPFLVSGYINAFGGKLWDEQTKTLGVNSPATKAAVEYLLNTFKPFMSSDPSWNSQVALFVDNKEPFAINGPWQTGSWHDAKIDFGIATLPEITELGKAPVPYTGVKSIYMTKDVRNKQAAFTFMVWATTSQQRILQRALQLGYIPVLKDVVNLPEIQNDPIISAFAQEVAMGVPMSSSPEMVAVWGPFGDALTAIFSGSQTVDKALDDAQAKIQEAINQMK